MSLRDRINNKFSKSKLEQAFPFHSFDQTTLNITSLGGQSQLCPIKLNCTWNPSTTQFRIPELACKWYNRTSTSLKQIQGVNGSYYQPSLADVGSIIHIQCIPQLQGVQYEGMPIIKDIGPIKVDPQTQEEANDFLQAQKATFFIKIKEININQDINEIPHQGLIKMNKSYFTLISRFNQEEKQIISEEMTQQTPEFICERVNPKELKIITENKIVKVELSNNKVRDVLCLLNKFIISRREDETTTKQTFEGENKLEEEFQKKQNDTQVKQVKSSEEINLKKAISVSPKQSASELMEISELKKQLRRVENENYQLNKTVNEKNDKIYQLEDKLSQGKQRESSLNRNYFQLQERINTINRQEGRISQQMSFYQNQCRIFKSEIDIQKKKITQLQRENCSLTSRLQPFQMEQLSYFQMKKQFLEESQMRSQLQRKLDYLKQQMIKIQEESSEIREKMNELQSQRKSYQKKYQSLSNQLQYQYSGSKSLIKEKSILSKSSNEEKDFIREKMENQILELKRQLKEIIEENNYLRSLNLKDKKNSSKTQLKAQLIQLKKLANRLAETVTEKDLALEQMRKVNKDLSERMIELSRFQYQNQPEVQ